MMVEWFVLFVCCIAFVVSRLYYHYAVMLRRCNFSLGLLHFIGFVVMAAVLLLFIGFACVFYDFFFRFNFLILFDVLFYLCGLFIGFQMHLS